MLEKRYHGCPVNYRINSVNLYAKGFGSPGFVYSFTSSGVGTLLFGLSDPEFQSKAVFNGDDSELYTRSGATIRRYNSSTGGLIGSFSLIGLAVNELSSPASVAISTTSDGRIFTYASGIVSEWDLGGNRIGTTAVPIATPTSSETTWSFSVANGLIFLQNPSSGNWETFSF